MTFSLQVLINYYRATVHVTGVNWAIKQRALIIGQISLTRSTTQFSSSELRDLLLHPFRTGSVVRYVQVHNNWLFPFGTFQCQYTKFCTE